MPSSMRVPTRSSPSFSVASRDDQTHDHVRMEEQHVLPFVLELGHPIPLEYIRGPGPTPRTAT